LVITSGFYTHRISFEEFHLGHPLRGEVPKRAGTPVIYNCGGHVDGVGTAQLS